MRLQRFITETEEVSGAAPEEKEVVDKEPELTPEQEEAQAAEEEKVKAIDMVVDTVKAAVDKNGLNGAVKKAAPLYKEYGEQWFKDLKKSMLVHIKPEMVDRFMEITKNFSDKLVHLKEK